MPMAGRIGWMLVAGLSLAAPAPGDAQRAAAPAPGQQDPFPSRYVQPRPDDMLLRGATILDGAGGRIDGGDVLVRGGRIVAVGRALANPGVREVDAKGRWITPGVIDVHSHDGTFVRPLTDIDREASDVAETATPNSADTWIETAVNAQDMAFDRALAAGVTTIQILPGSTPIFGGRSVVVKPVRAPTVWDMKVAGAVQGFKMACGENPKSWGAEKDQDGPTSREGVIAYMRQRFIEAQEYRRAWERHRAGAGPAPARDLKLEAIAGILTGDIRVNLHCYRAGDIAAMLNIAKEFGFRIGAIHHATEAYKIPGLLRAAGTCAAVWADWWGFKMEAQDAIRAEAPLLEREGVCVMMHSDSPADGQRLNIAAAKAAAAGRRIGIVTPPETMIKWTTSNPAKLLGLDTQIGTLAPGYRADLVLWSGDPFSVYSRADLVLIDGAIAWDRAQPRTAPVSDFELGRRSAQP
ncbi:amidohydrolase family protein [Sphingomonas sp.]|uniref:amidohydrolase family protein n=1 Tax=Sphingomonas sp. TaxID=28214 RepID=UPI001EBBFF23|nr:amidohydrolase family protein [Sphingomonas sp.]MBX3594605.1 amidohydrolase family protein [Sphingomonas sp.]